ncbi:hypothetical protein CRUP_031298 [Coryphaenoides rupestris]|nr:hypothetical protein CRUP_031298 [Coryphaenoides rupestris]
MEMRSVPEWSWGGVAGGQVGVTGQRSAAAKERGRNACGPLTLSKWLKEARNSFICSWLMPLASRVRIWFSISLMVRAMVVSSCSQPTRMCCGRGRLTMFFSYCRRWVSWSSRVPCISMEMRPISWGRKTTTEEEGEEEEEEEDTRH